MRFFDVVDGSGQPGHPTGTDGVIGYIVNPKFAGQGIGSATARALLRAAFDGLRLRRVTAAANADNVASVRVLERVGMRRERHALKALWHRELGWLDEVEYAIFDEEWAAQSPQARAPIPYRVAPRAHRHQDVVGPPVFDGDEGQTARQAEHSIAKSATGTESISAISGTLCSRWPPRRLSWGCEPPRSACAASDRNHRRCQASRCTFAPYRGRLAPRIRQGTL